ncbi:MULTISPECIES: hypothetical protein [unclassified Streptomyces]|nr:MULTISPECIES: hypothetical protein [unclassified Streptomyces]
MTAAARLLVDEGIFGNLDAGEIPIETADRSQEDPPAAEGRQRLLRG